MTMDAPTYLQCDPSLRDVLDDVVHVCLWVRVVVDFAHHVGREDVVAVANALGVQVGDGLVDRRWPVSFSGVARGVEEVLVREPVRVDVVAGWVPHFSTGHVQRHDGHLLLGLDFDRRGHERHGRQPVHAFERLVAVALQERSIVVRELGREHAEGRHNDAEPVCCCC